MGLQIHFQKGYFVLKNLFQAVVLKISDKQTKNQLRFRIVNLINMNLRIDISSTNITNF